MPAKIDRHSYRVPIYTYFRLKLFKVRFPVLLKSLGSLWVFVAI